MVVHPDLRESITEVWNIFTGTIAKMNLNNSFIKWYI